MVVLVVILLLRRRLRLPDEHGLMELDPNGPGFRFGPVCRETESRITQFLHGSGHDHVVYGRDGLVRMS